MAERINKVILVLDRNYGERLSSVPTDSHIWLIDSHSNLAAASSYRTLHGPSNAESGVTTFKAADDASTSEICLGVLNDIDLHHGKYSLDPPYSVLEVVGTRPSRSVRLAVQALGFNRFEKTADGFRAIR